MLNFTTRKTFLFPSFELDEKEREKLDRFLLLLEKSKVEELFSIRDDKYFEKGGRTPYSCYDLFAVILYGFAFGSPTLRDLEDSCRFDLRYIYLMQQERPTHIRFGEFINEIILPHRREIFKRITKTIIKELNIDISDCFVDGSKFEADANKYKFVWKPTTFHNKLSDKIRKLLNEVGLSRGIPNEGIISSRQIADKLSELYEIRKNGTYYEKQFNLLNDYLIKALEYEEKERICGPNRNSYYKTDHDATAMSLKADYYSGLGSNMHAAYNSQLLVSKGIICSYYVSQSTSDFIDFIPILKAFYDIFEKYPKRVCADAGYGSLGNYRFLYEHEIENYVKFSNFEGNVSGRNPDRYYLKKDGTITCLNNLTGRQIEISGRHPKYQGAVFYQIEGCRNCSFSQYCKKQMKNKDEDFRIFEIQKDLILYKQDAFENLLSPKGIEMRVNRSSQVEGAFGVIKEDMNYTRLRRTTMEKVDTEFMLTYMGYNIRKLFRFFEGKAKLDYWKAPANLEPEIKKKPSAKRLSKKASKKKVQPVNKKARDYKYKEKGAVTPETI